MTAFSRAAALALLVAGTLAAGQPAAHVTLTAAPGSAWKAGTAQNLRLFFHPKKGIHINLDPAIDVTSQSAQVGKIGKISASKDAHGYLDPSKPVLVSVTPPAAAPKGKQMLTLKVVYFLCSDAEGWCNRDEQSLDVPVTVK